MSGGILEYFPDVLLGTMQYEFLVRVPREEGEHLPVDRWLYIRLKKETLLISIR